MLFPRMQHIWAHSSVGRAFGSHPRGRGFESLWVHQRQAAAPKTRTSLCGVRFFFCPRFEFGFIYVQHSQRRDAAPKTRTSLCGVRFFFCPRFWFEFISVQHSQRRDAAPKTRTSLCGVRFFFVRVFSKENRRSFYCGDFSFVYLTGTLFAGAPVFFVYSGPGMEGFFYPGTSPPVFSSFSGTTGSKNRGRTLLPSTGE